MKKLLLFVIATTIATSLSAQFYVGLNAGYGIGASQRVNGVETTSNSDINIYGSYGEGLNMGLKLGYMFNENLGFELGSSYLMGFAQTKIESDKISEEAKSSGLRLSPQFVMKLESGLYTRFGMIIPVLGTTVITKVDDHFQTGATSYAKKETTVETKGSFSYGFIGAVGYAYSLSDNMDLFAEIEYIGLSIKSGTAELTQFDLDGIDQLDNLKTNQKEFEFVDEIKDTDNTNNDQATKELKQKAPFSSLGVNIGIIMKF